MPITRKLAAVLVADIAGYSRLMRADEMGTYTAVRQLREDLLPQVLIPHAGRLVKDMGDGFLVTFDSAVQAVECGIAIQEALAGHEILELRIGVNIGDVIVEDKDVFGDGVNVAARLEAICTPGGVAMSESVYEQVRDKLTLSVETLEPQTLKNIDRPVGVRLWKGRELAATDPESLEPNDKPSIAVLAFANMSSDPEQEYFADGIAEDVITALSRIERFFVVSRTSSFSFKGQKLEVKRIGEALGVRYVLEGSVRAAAGRLRVNAQLIEADTGRHIWAEKYDRSAEAIFDIQDEIVRNIVSTIWWELTGPEEFTAPRVEKSSLPVWRLTSLAWNKVYEMTPDSLLEAIEFAEQAIDLDAKNGRAHQAMAMSVYHRAMFGADPDIAGAISKGLQFAELAVRYSNRDEWSYLVRALILNRSGYTERAMADLKLALEINPNCSLAYGAMGAIYSRTGRPEEGIKAEQFAIETSPRSGDIFFRYTDLALCHLILEDFEKAIEWGQRALSHRPSYIPANAFLIAALQASGRSDEALTAVKKFDDACGTITSGDLEPFIPLHSEHKERILELLADAGLFT